MEGFRGNVEQRIRQWSRWLLDAFFPERCVVCGREGSAFCIVCSEQTLPRPFSSTLKDGTPISALYHYADPRLRSVFGAYKFRGRSGARAAIALLVQRASAQAHTLLPHGPAILVPIPLGRMRMRERGFNQAEEFAMLLLPMLRDGSLIVPMLRRVRATRQQSSAPKDARRENVANAFALQSDLPFIEGKRIVLVDDVVTSGETLMAAAGLLRAAGYKNISAVVFSSAG